jgi:hypothetical protein
MNDMVARVRLAKTKFISYHERGVSNAKWYRSNTMYLYWAVCKDDTKLDDDLLDLWSRVSKIFEIENEKDYNEMLLQFDLMEKVAKMWSFS